MRHSLALILLFALTACGTAPNAPIGSKLTAAEIYQDAQSETIKGNFERTIKLLDTLIARYPYGPYAQQALMEMAYAHYKHQEHDAALTHLERFIKQYPTSPRLDYIYYLKGVINFNADLGRSSAWVGFPRDLSRHDPQQSRESLAAFQDLVTRFPGSIYVPDAKLRITYLSNVLALHELNVARYYMRRGAYVAAANRAKAVLTEFPQTSQTQDALQVLAQSYDALGLKDLAADTRLKLSQQAQPAPQPAPRL